MSESPGVRVGTLRLRLLVHGALGEAEAQRLRAEVESQLLVSVLAALDGRLRAELGADVVVRVRRLAWRFSLDGGALSDGATLERLADELARDLLAEIGTQSESERLRPRSASLVVFESARHFEAAYLADVADGQAETWFHAGAREPDAIWQGALDAGAGELEKLVGLLERMQRLERTLALAPGPVLARLASALPALAGLAALTEARRALATPRLAVAGDAAVAPSAERDVRAGAPSIRESADGELSFPQAPSAAPAPATGGEAELAPHPARSHERASESNDPALAAPGAGPAPAGRGPGEATRADARGREAPEAPPEVEPRLAEAREPEPLVDPALAVATRHAGLFYLAGRVLEIDLAETLWAVGVSEGDVLAHVARSLLDDAGDPAWRWFGGAFERVPELPGFSSWALGEIRNNLGLGLGRRLARFGIVKTPIELDAELDHLAASVPFRVHAEAGGAEVVARSAAALATIVAARLREPPSWPLLGRVIARPGRLVRGDDALRVVLPASAVDLEHRRAGLDQDPGYLPWLGRKLCLEFVGGEAL